MQYTIIAYDYKDALDRRLKEREKHLALAAELKTKGIALYGVALLNEAGNMCGSIYVLDFPSRKELDAFLEIEPYVTGKVWEKIEIMSCKVGSAFN